VTGVFIPILCRRRGNLLVGIRCAGVCAKEKIMRSVVVAFVLAAVCSLCIGVHVGLATASTSDSDVMRLVDGQVIVGKLVRFDGDVFEIETEEETLYIKREEVIGFFMGISQSPEMEELSQWATGALASSQYSDTRWSAAQAAGEPNTEKCGDLDTAWAPKTSGEQEEWLEASFAVPVYASGVRVHETYTAGFVYRIDLVDEKGAAHTVWQGKDETACPGWLEVSFPRTSYRVSSARVHTQIKGWEEIDAVELIGYREVETALLEGEGDTGEDAGEEVVGEEVGADVYTVAELLRQKSAIGSSEVKVQGWARNIEQEKGIFGSDFTSFDLVGEDGSSFLVHLDRKVEGIPTKRQVIVTGTFEKLFGDFIEFFSASEVTW
jgi:hypothetical protein